MGYNLYICEKPSQAQDLARNLHAKRSKSYYATSDDSIRVTWCLGHLLELCPPEAYDPAFKSWRLDTLPIIPPKFKYEVKKKTADQYKIVSTLIKEASLVTIATDYDREGEAIARTILERTRYKGPIKRLCLTALDDKSINRALNNIVEGCVTEPLYHAAIARSQADWIVGMNLSRLFTLITRKSGANTLITAGRVQTPMITLVTERDQAIKDFEPKPFYDLYIDLSTPLGETYRATWLPPEEVTDEDGHVLNRQNAEEVAARTINQKLTVTKAEAKTSKQAPMLPYDLTSLQQFCNKRYGFSAAKTLSIAQSLYEKHKATSYPRTDCRYIPTSQLSDAPEILATLKDQDPEFAPLVLGASTSIKPRSFNQSKITAHHAIIPTGNPKVSLGHMSSEERKIYDAVRRAYLAQFYPDAIYRRSEINLNHGTDEFRAVSRILAEPGWRILFGAKKGEAAPEGETSSRATSSKVAANANESTSVSNTQDNSKGESVNDSLDEKTQEEISLAGQILPDAKVGEAHLCVETDIKDKMTTPPSHYTEATLLSAMENIHRTITDPRWKKMLKETAGLGTPATRAQIIDSAVDREYLTRNGKYIISTDKARFMTGVIPADIRSAGMTAVWEQALESIAHGSMDSDKFMDSIIRWIKHVIEENSHLTLNAELLKNAVNEAPGPQGSKSNTSRGTRSTTRTTTRKTSSSSSRTSTRQTSTRGTSTRATSTGGTSRSASSTKTTATHNTFYRATNTQSTQGTTQLENNIRCPRCGEPMVKRRNRNTGEEFYGCSNYPNCRGIINLGQNSFGNNGDDSANNAAPNSSQVSATTTSKTRRTRTTSSGTTTKATSTRSLQGAKTQNAPNNNAKTSRRSSSSATTNEAPRCPKCGSEMILRHSSVNGEAFYGCSNFPNCRGTRPASSDASFYTSQGNAQSGNTHGNYQGSSSHTFRPYSPFTGKKPPANFNQGNSEAHGADFYQANNNNGSFTSFDGDYHEDYYSQEYSYQQEDSYPPTRDVDTKGQTSPSPNEPNYDPNYIPPSDDDYPW